MFGQVVVPGGGRRDVVKQGDCFVFLAYLAAREEFLVGAADLAAFRQQE